MLFVIVVNFLSILIGGIFLLDFTIFVPILVIRQRCSAAAVLGKVFECHVTVVEFYRVGAFRVDYFRFEGCGAFLGFTLKGNCDVLFRLCVVEIYQRGAAIPDYLRYRDIIHRTESEVHQSISGQHGSRCVHRFEKNGLVGGEFHIGLHLPVESIKSIAGMDFIDSEKSLDSGKSDTVSVNHGTNIKKFC